MKLDRNTNKSIGIFGGSFDPPHKAHIALAQQVLQHPNGVDYLFIIPAYTHAFGKVLTPYEQRFAMLMLAFSAEVFSPYLRKRILISRIEQRLGGTSYTFETVEALKQQYPNAQFHLLLGSDTFRDIPLWHRADELLKIASPIVFPRDGFACKKVMKANEKWLHDVKLPAFSSTEIRALYSTGGNHMLLASMMPEPILEYIRKHKLYQSR
ncbi:nicotinate (nicotinamide) nucleotide adenylyltransferase [Candidatus Sumerlaeota bacterium]|nr:nicotinate (nicotinamide) nucleotide adenylyltransferase [Candidatus Sumerlaeales bacterium]NLD61814.1 nicotinate (nicotinamide) nucleotide adenylyltransferase [Candidatus Sumerlaeota bacterium]